jgi:catechol 2,3-dioxygenase-like lactoylglutathione lyase family enzyme
VFVSRYFAHANVNTADLDRAEDFYCSVLGLRPLGPTVPDRDQDGTPFDLVGQDVTWRGVFLADGRGLKGPVVDLLEWVKPPTARPGPAEESSPGLRALGFAVGDADSALQKLARYGRPARRCRVFYGDSSRDFVLTSDLDGTRLEIVADPVSPRYESIRLACRDLAVSVAFYRDVLHLQCEPATEYRVEADGDVIEHGTNVRAYLPGQREKFWLNLTQPSNADAMPASTRRGNTAGLYRMALLTTDINRAYEDLRRSLPDAPRPSKAYVGEQYAPVPAIFFRDPGGTVVEYLEGMFVQ